MANKRVSELSPITAAELSMADLLLLADVTAHESKKLTLQDFTTFLLDGGNITASLYGTASWATWAVNALNAPTQASASYAATASWAWRSITSSLALNAVSASYSLSGSYVISASYALSSSVQTIYSSAFADIAKSASYLIYTPGVSNGTASYAMYTLSSSYALSSSINISSSYATVANSSVTSSYLLYDGSLPNGTASYSLSASYANSASHAIQADIAYFSSFSNGSVTADNGVFGRYSAIAYTIQANTGSTEASPIDVTDSTITVTTSKSSGIYLINMSIAVGGVTGVSLWRSSSAGDSALIKTIGITSSSISSVWTITATYLDSPSLLSGATIYYRARVYNNSGSYYVNRSFDNTKFGTSSISVIEF